MSIKQRGLDLESLQSWRGPVSGGGTAQWRTDGCRHERRGDPGGGCCRHGLQRAEPSGSGPAADPRAGGGGDGTARVHPQRLGAPAPGGPQPVPRARRPGRDEPVLHRGRARRRGLRPGRGLRRDPLQLRRGRTQGAPVPAGPGGAAGTRHPHHAGARPGAGAARHPGPRHAGGAARPAGSGRAVLGRGRRPAGRRARGRAPARAGPPAHRARQRPAGDPAVRGPAPRRVPGRRQGRSRSGRGPAGGPGPGHEHPLRRRRRRPAPRRRCRAGPARPAWRPEPPPSGPSPPGAPRPRPSAPTTCWPSACCAGSASSARRCPGTWRSSATTTSTSPPIRRSR